MSVRGVVVLGVLGLGVLPGGVWGQRRASELGSVSQVVNGTTIRVEYSRPLMRGRTAFGEQGKGVVHWGEIWTPGANWATTFEVDRDVEVNGKRLAKGKYSVWMVPQPEEWTVRFNPNARLYHTRRPDARTDSLSFTVKPSAGPSMETLLFYFPEVRRDGATLHMHWSTTVVPLDIRVFPPAPVPIAAGDRARYVGEYDMRMSGGDTAKVYRITVMENGEFLKAKVEPRFWRDYDAEFDLNVRGDAFKPLMYVKGEARDEEDVRFVFQGEAGKAPGFLVYGPGGRTFASGVRVR